MSLEVVCRVVSKSPSAGIYASWLAPLPNCHDWWKIWRAFAGERATWFKGEELED